MVKEENHWFSFSFPHTLKSSSYIFVVASENEKSALLLFATLKFVHSMDLVCSALSLTTLMSSHTSHNHDPELVPSSDGKTWNVFAFFSSLWSVKLCLTTAEWIEIQQFLSYILFPGVMQATTGEAWEKRYSPNFRDTNGSSDSLRRQSSTKRKRDEVLRLVLSFGDPSQIDFHRIRLFLHNFHPCLIFTSNKIIRIFLSYFFCGVSSSTDYFCCYLL